MKQKKGSVQTVVRLDDPAQVRRPQGGTGPIDDDDGDDNVDDEGDGDDNDTDDEKYIRRPTWQPATAHRPTKAHLLSTMYFSLQIQPVLINSFTFLCGNVRVSSLSRNYDKMFESYLTKK